MTVKRGMKALCDYEYIVETGTRTRGYRHGYRLTKDEGLSLADVSSIPAPEVLALKAKQAGIIV
jgi:hypothetical protein